jgi:hypothetical protein
VYFKNMKVMEVVIIPQKHLIPLLMVCFSNHKNCFACIITIIVKHNGLYTLHMYGLATYDKEAYGCWFLL